MVGLGFANGPAEAASQCAERDYATRVEVFHFVRRPRVAAWLGREGRREGEIGDSALLWIS